MTDQNDAYDIEPTPASKDVTPPDVDIDASTEARGARPPAESVVTEPEAAEATTKRAATPVAVPKPHRPLVRSNNFEWPLAVAGCAFVIFVAASLAGAEGLFPNFNDGAAVVPSWLDRFIMVLKGGLRILLGGGCLVAGAYFLQLLDRRPVGDLRALASRMLAIVAIALLAMLFPISMAFPKHAFDAVVPLAIAWALIIPFFRISPRDAGVILVGGLVSLTVLAFGSMIVNFIVR